MGITVETHDASVVEPAQLELINSSGANVEVFVFIADRPAVRHAFDFSEDTVTKPLPGLARGVHPTTVIVRAMKNLNRMYSVIVGINGEIVAVADGNIPAERGNDSGSGDFTLTVAGAA
jgi:hypothetical protein